MPLEDIRLAYAIVEDWECYVCANPFEVQRLKLQSADGETDFVSEYDCQECDAVYQVEISVRDDTFTADGYRIDIETRPPDWDISSVADRESLYEKAHPSRDLVEALRNLNTVVGILMENKDRVLDCHEKLKEIDNLATESLECMPEVEIHNYLSCSYTFAQVLETIKPDLPSGDPIDKSMYSYNEEYKVISGLRIYSQHHLVPGLGYTSYYSEETEEQRFSFTIDIDEVWVNESGLSKYENQGYKHGAEYHYGHIDGDKIDVPLHVERHFESVVNLFEDIWEYVEETRGDDLEDYQKRTSR